MAGIVRSLVLLAASAGIAGAAAGWFKFSFAQGCALAGGILLLGSWLSTALGMRVFSPLEDPRLGLLLFLAVVILAISSFFVQPLDFRPSFCGTCNEHHFSRMVSGTVVIFFTIPYGVGAIVDRFFGR